MMKKVLALLVLTVFVAGISYSCKLFKKESTEESATTEESAATETETATPAAGGGGACDAYGKCCEAYVKALEGVSGMPAASLSAAKDGCKQIENLKGMPTADTACKSAMDAMKQGAEAYKAMPGFKFPTECQ